MSEKKNVKKPLTQTNNYKKPLSLNMDFPSNTNLTSAFSLGETFLLPLLKVKS